MLTQEDITLHTTVSFDLWPASILGISVKGAKVQAIVDGDTALVWQDVRAMHANVYPTLPPGTINRFDGYPYLKLKLMDGTIRVIGLPWIKEETYVEANTNRLQITVDNVSDADLDIIRTALSANGYGAASYLWLT